MADNRGNLRGSASGASGISVHGSDQFYRVSRALKQAGEGDLRKQFHKTVRDAAKPLVPKVRASARAKGPKKGGLSERLAKNPYRVQTRTGAATAGVRIVGTKVDPRINASGRVAHPVFGREKSTVVQIVPGLKGYFDAPLEESGPEVRRQVIAAMSSFLTDLSRRA